MGKMALQVAEEFNLKPLPPPTRGMACGGFLLANPAWKK